MNPLLLQITPFGLFHGTSLFAAVGNTTLFAALGNMVLFAFVAIVLLFFAFKTFDKAITRIDLEAEVARGNVAAGIVVGSVILAIGIIIAVAMM